MIHHQDPWLTIHAGDSRDVLRELPAASVHCVVTSPPYWNLRDYGVPGQLGLEATPEAYVDAIVGVFREVRRVLRPDGTLWLNLGDTYADRANMGRGATSRRDRAQILPPKLNTIGGRFALKAKDLVGIPWRVAFALQADGWYLRSDVIWSKPNPMPESARDRPTNAHEHLFLLSRSERYHYDADAIREPHARDWSGGRSGGTLAGRGKRPEHPPQPGDPNYRGGSSQWERTEAPEPNPAGRNRRNVWTIPTQSYPDAHFATFPEALVEPCIMAGTSERGTCSECGAPWRRVVERPKRGSWRSHTDTTGDLRHGAAGKRGEGPTLKGLRDRPAGVTSWRIACDHEAPPTPTLVMDPFAGSGTVGLVANRLSRRALLVDLNPEYLDQQLRRTVDRPLGL